MIWTSRRVHRLVRMLWPGLGMGLGLAAWAPAPAAAQLPRKAVRTLDSLLDSAPFDRNLWGVALVDERGRLLYGRNADKLFIPASNTKLVVTAVASALFDPAWTVRTSLYATGPVVDGTVQGDLVLYGRGDPTFSHRCYATDTTQAGACDADPLTRFRALAQDLRAAGVHSIGGNLVGDGSWFSDQLIPDSWNAYDLNWWYAAPVAGLGFNDNSVDITWAPGVEVGAPVRLELQQDYAGVTLENRASTVAAGGETDVGDRMYREPGTLHLWAEGTVALDRRGGTESFALPDPNLFAARALRRALEEAGISVLGTTLSTTDSLRYQAARGGPPLAESSSRPLHDWIFPILNTSQNWFAEMLLKQLGRQFGAGGSWHDGLAVERRFLVDSMGIDSTLFALSDGSGLAASNLMAPLAFTRLLQFIRRHPHYRTNFEPGLPQSGNTGSLRSRFIGTPIEGRVRAKTGSISRVNTLSGYLEMPDGHVFAFSVQANHHAQGGRAAIRQIDAIVEAMARAVAGRK